MPYSLDDFCKDTRGILKSELGPAAVEKIRANMERLIKNGDFIKQHFHDDVEYGVRRIYVDPELGFVVLGYRCENAHSTPVHDHGDSWAVYGQVREYTEMTEYDRIDDGKDPSRATLNLKSQYKFDPGQAGMYWGQQLHAAFTPVNSCYLRVTGTDLEKISRVRIDQATGKIIS